MNTDDGLPRYERPPVIEVVQGVQFPPLALTPVHYGLFFQRLRDRFPKQQLVPPLPPVVERFDGPSLGASAVTLDFMLDGPIALPRMWFISADDLNLIQLQSDRLLFNWRRQPHTLTYPHYAHVRGGFVDAHGHLQELAFAEGLGDLTATECELTYVNHIVPPPGSGLHHPERVFRWWSDSTASGSGQQEDVWFNVRRRLLTDRGDAWGRLYVKVAPALTPERQQIFVAELTVRGPSVGAGLEDALTFHDLAHTAIVNTFTAMTSDEMHRAWGRIQ